MSRSSLQDQTSIPLIVTTNDGGTARSSTGTSLDSCSFRAKSCRSFYSRSSSHPQQKLNSESHRNKSVPHNLQVDSGTDEEKLFWAFQLGAIKIHLHKLKKRCNLWAIVTEILKTVTWNYMFLKGNKFFNLHSKMWYWLEFCIYCRK